MNHKNKSSTLLSLLPPYTSLVTNELRVATTGRPKVFSDLLKTVGPDQSAFIALEVTLTTLVGCPNTKTSVLVSRVADSLDLEARMKGVPQDNFLKHRLKGNAPAWSKHKAIRLRTQPTPKPTLLALSNVLVSLLCNLYPDVFIVTTSWKGKRMSKTLRLHHDVSSSLLRENPVTEAAIKAGPVGTYDPTNPDLIPGSRGGYPIAVPTDTNLYIHTDVWMFDPNTLRDMRETLTAGRGFFGIFPEKPTEGATRGETQAAWRQYHEGCASWTALQRATREVSSLSGPAQYPLSLDFRGRVYLSGASSPQSFKSLRGYVLTPDNKALTYYDMRTSNVTLLRLLSGQDVGEDMYDAAVGLLSPVWSSLLAETYGAPERDLMKLWTKGIMFGQRKRDSLHAVTRQGVHTGTHNENLHAEVLRVHDILWEFCLGFASPNIFEPVTDSVTLPDGFTVPLTYRKSEGRRIKTQLRGTVPSFTYRTFINNTNNTQRSHRALSANVVHSVEAYILRQIIRYLDRPVLPIHDCFGTTLLSTVEEQAIADLVSSSVSEVQALFHSVGLLSRTKEAPAAVFGDLFKTEQYFKH